MTDPARLPKELVEQVIQGRFISSVDGEGRTREMIERK